MIQWMAHELRSRSGIAAFQDELTRKLSLSASEPEEFSFSAISGFLHNSKSKYMNYGIRADPGPVFLG